MGESIQQGLFVCALFLCLAATTLDAQDCKLPVLSSFESQSTSSLALRWLDFNADNPSWEIEHGPKGFVRTGSPTVSNITQSNYTLTGLQPGTTYEVYLRSVCNPNASSNWNGPYFSNTNIANDRSCNLGLEITDNNCPLVDRFRIEVSGFEGLEIGRDLELDKVELVIQHPWPPDLQLSLIAPDGTAVFLSKFNGNGIDDYGNSISSDCQASIEFTDNACLSIDEASPPFVGQFKSEQTFTDNFQGVKPDGVWELTICDRANGDLGFLQFVYLNFSEEACVIPPSFVLADVEADRVTVTWDQNSSCQAIELNYKPVSAPIQATASEYVECNEQQFTLLDLVPDTEYEIVLRSDCGSGDFSPASCPFLFRTACSNSTQREEFDAQSICSQSCSDLCKITGLWSNAGRNETNWLISQGATNTTFTGPTSDRKGNGRYIYIETQEDICDSDAAITLVSKCLSKDEDDSCALSFSYHMYGSDVGALLIEYSVDSLDWITIWSATGEQSENWLSANVELPTSFDRGLIRFVAMRSPSGARGDVALDNIKLIGIDTITPLHLYRDNDNDGFGNSAEPILLCSSFIAAGYATNQDDCDDDNAEVYPGAVELACNQIDDNCNGIADDAGTSEIGYILGNITPESCKGAEDGIIIIQAVSGQGPYTYEWSDGSLGQGVTDLGTGIYYCTISDAGGCQVVTDPVFLDFADIIVYSVRSLESPTCFGDEDGSIELLVAGGQPPYSIRWNNGDAGSSISRLPDGYYAATITDGSSCAVVTDSLKLSGPQVLTVGVIDQRDNECYNDSTGYIQLGIIGGLPPYDIKWSSGQETSIINNLKVGHYSVTVQDNNSCLNILKDLRVEQPEVLSVELSAIEHVTCHGGSNAFVDIKVSGGTAPYSFFWSDGSNDQDLINKKAGLYSVTVSDIKSCTTILDAVSINEPAAISVAADSIQNVNCSGSDYGYVSVNVSGGTGSYSYNWGLFDGSEVNEDFLDSLSPGNYSLTVVDDFDCKSSALSLEVANINVPLEVDLATLSDVSCFGDSTGQVTATLYDGLAPFDFNWSSGEKNIVANALDTITGLLAGSYNLTVTDAEGCIGIADSIAILSSTELNYVVVSKLENICWYDTTGFIELGVEGGTMPYNVDWSSGDAGDKISNLSDGNYKATITDSQGCQLLTTEVALEGSEPILLNFDLTHPTATELGSISIEPFGGNGEYFYSWGDPLQLNSASIAPQLVPGEYSVTVTDGNGCAIDTIIELKIMTSVIDSYTNPISVYPNPSSGLFILDSGDQQFDYLDIFNSDGKMIRTIELESAKTYLDLRSCGNGIFFIACHSDKARIIEKVLILK